MDFQESYQREVIQHMATLERFQNQAETIEDWGARLERIFTRHSGRPGGACDWCGNPFPCDDRKDAEWRP